MTDSGAATPPCDVLVVDDEPVVREGVRRVLAAHGYRVDVAGDARSGLAHPALPLCRLVLCDFMLPDRSGPEIVRGIRASRPELPIVVITGYATDFHRAQALDAGATDFLPKPFDEEELVATVRRFLEEGADPNGAVPDPRPDGRRGPSGAGGS